VDSGAIKPGAAGNDADGHGKEELVPREELSRPCEASLEEKKNIQTLRIDLVQVLPKLHALLGMLRDLKKRRDRTDDGS
jgi:hypothetical protein